MASLRPLFTLATLVAAASTLALLHACQDPVRESEPTAATAATGKTLSISGGGTGNGTVTSSPAGIDCTITNGTAATSGCSARFETGVAVALTATAKSGSSFAGWLDACTGLV